MSREEILLATSGSLDAEVTSSTGEGKSSLPFPATKTLWDLNVLSHFLQNFKPPPIDPQFPPVLPSQANFNAYLKFLSCLRDTHESQQQLITSSSGIGANIPSAPVIRDVKTSLIPSPIASGPTPNKPATGGANRMSYPREFKLMVIKFYYDNGQNKYRTCKQFQITKSMLNGWLAKADKIRQSRPGSLKSGRSGRRPQFPDVEKQLYDIYRQQVSLGMKVGNRWIRDTARQLATAQCSQTALKGMCQFSERWLANFKRRFGVNLTKDWTSQTRNGSTPVGDKSPEGSKDPTEEDRCSSESSKISSDDLEGLSDGSDTDSVADDHHFSPTTIVSKVEEGHTNNNQKNNSDLPTQPTNYPTSVIVPSPLLHPALAMAIRLQQQFGQQNNQLLVPPAVPKRPTAIPTGTEPGKRGRKVQFPDVEEALYQRYLQRQSDNLRVSNRWLQDEARQMAAEMCPDHFADAVKSARCMFSEHWLHNFKKRFRISLKNIPKLPMTPTATNCATATDRSIDDLPTLVPLLNPSTNSKIDWYSESRTDTPASDSEDVDVDSLDS